MSPLRQELLRGLGWESLSLGDDELTENMPKPSDHVLWNPKAVARNGPVLVEIYRVSWRIGPAYGRRGQSRQWARQRFMRLSGSRSERPGRTRRPERDNDFTLINRTRNGEGEFAPEGQVTSQSIRRAYAPNSRERTTGKTTSTVGAVGAAAGLAGAIAHLRGRKGKRPRLTGGSVPQLGFAAKDDGSHPVRDTLAGVGAGALGVAGLLALRKRRLASLADRRAETPSEDH